MKDKSIGDFGKENRNETGKANRKEIVKANRKETGKENRNEIIKETGIMTGNDTGTGSVTLVGAGCGPGLITVLGLRALRAAEVLVYDDLIDPALPEETPAGCEKIYVGKRSGAHSLPQEEISRLLCEKAAAGKNVVRLKGGDSFVFGRGGEECLALQKAGIPYQVIPGVTSAAAVPEHFGIPVTHRGTAQSFTVVTGHSGTGEEENYEALAGLKGTLVFLMGIRRLKEITGKLMECGKDPETPAAVLTEGFSPSERRIDGTLGTIAMLAENAPTPGILVVGPAAGFRLFCPLRGCSVTVAGSAQFAEKTAGFLREMGAAAGTAVCLRTEALEEKLPETFEEDSWIVFTSANGIDHFFRRMTAEGRDPGSLGKLRFACIGRATAKKLESFGFRAELVPEVYSSAALGKALASKIREEQASGKAEKTVFLFRAEQGSNELPEALAEAGIPFEDRKLYRTVPVPPAESGGSSGNGGTDLMKTGAGMDRRYLVFGSAGCVRAWFSFGGIPEGTVPVCIGAYTAAELRKHWSGRALTAAEYSREGIAAVMAEDLRG